MRLTCSLCKETIPEDGPVTTSYGNEEIYSFCSKECVDKWTSDGAPGHACTYTCAQCKKVLGKLESPVEFWSYTESEYFCSQICKDKWLQGLPEDLRFDCPPIDHPQPQESSNERVQNDEPRLRTVQ